MKIVKRTVITDRVLKKWVYQDLKNFAWRYEYPIEFHEQRRFFRVTILVEIECPESDFDRVSDFIDDYLDLLERATF